MFDYTEYAWDFGDDNHEIYIRHLHQLGSYIFGTRILKPTSYQFLTDPSDING
jgi:hypothetical protein